jgi:hypothetical protein
LHLDLVVVETPGFQVLKGKTHANSSLEAIFPSMAPLL